MGIPIKKLLEIIVGVAGIFIPNANKEILEVEVKENQLLGQILRQATITNAVLLKILEHDDPDSFKELMKVIS